MREVSRDFKYDKTVVAKNAGHQFRGATGDVIEPPKKLDDFQRPSAAEEAAMVRKPEDRV